MVKLNVSGASASVVRGKQGIRALLFGALASCPRAVWGLRALCSLCNVHPREEALCCPCAEYSRRDSNPQSPPQEGVALSIRPREQTHSLALERISEGLCRVCCSRDVPDPRRQSGMILAPVRKPRSRGIGILFLPPTKGEGTTPRGFEPLRAEPNRFRVHLLSRSDTVSCATGS